MFFILALNAEIWDIDNVNGKQRRNKMFYNLTNKEIKETLYFDIENEAEGFLKGLEQMLPATHRVEVEGEPQRLIRYGKLSVRLDITIRPAS